MRPRSPTLATLTTICLIMLTWLAQPTFAQAPNNDIDSPPHVGNETNAGLICRPFGSCGPCLNDVLKEPFCQPFGNRRLMHCVNDTSIPPLPPSQGLHPSRPNSHLPYPPTSLDEPHTTHPEGETLAWESCGRIVSQERADFYEFVACNILFAVISLFVVFVRSRRLRALQARQLAARIGIVRSAVGVQGRR